MLTDLREAFDSDDVAQKNRMLAKASVEIKRLSALVDDVFAWASDAEPSTKGAAGCLWKIKQLAALGMKRQK